MTPEFYAIIATGIALAGLILNNQRAMVKSIAELYSDHYASPERPPRWSHIRSTSIRFSMTRQIVENGVR